MPSLSLAAVVLPGVIRLDTCDAVALRVRRIVLPTAMLGNAWLGMTMTIQAVATDLRLLSADDTTAENADGTALVNYITCPAGQLVTVAIPLGSPTFRSVLSATAGQVYRVEISRPVGGVA